MDKSDLRIEQLQQYLDQKKEVVESNIKEYSQQLGKTIFISLTGMPMTCIRPIIWIKIIRLFRRRLMLLKRRRILKGF